MQMTDFLIFAKIIIVMVKKCFFCGSSNVVRNGLRGHVQRYKCKDCGRRFGGGNRRDRAQVIQDYIEGKQTLEQLADKKSPAALSPETWGACGMYRENVPMK